MLLPNLKPEFKPQVPHGRRDAVPQVTAPPHTQTLSLPYFGEKRGTRRAGERGKAALLKLQKVIAHYPTLRELGREDHKFEASLGCSWSHLKTKTKRLNYKFSFQYNYSGFKNKQKNKNT